MDLPVVVDAMIRSLLLPLAAAALVGLTAWTTTPDAPAPVMPPWTDTIDVWEGLCSQADALVDADSLKMPCLVGPGARRPPQLDSIAAGDGVMRVIRVTNYAQETGVGTLAAALDSAYDWSNGSDCTAVVFTTGGNPRMQWSTDTFNGDGTQCLYILGQTAQGGGVNIGGHHYRARSMQDVYAGYFFNRNFQNGFIFGSSSENMGSSGIYMEHVSRSWTNGTGGNMASFSCGTEIVNMVGTICRDATFANNLFFESDWAHPTGIHTGGTWPDTIGSGSAHIGVNKTARALLYRNYMGTIGQRCPLTGNADSIAVLDMVCYSFRNAFHQAGSNRDPVKSRVNVFNSYYRVGPFSTGVGGSGNSGWAIFVWLTDSTNLARQLNGTHPDSIWINVRNIRTNQNNYDSISTPADIHRGAERATACDDDVTTYGSSWCQTIGGGDSLPTAVYSGYNDTLRLGPSTAQPVYATLTDARTERIIQNAGNSRYVACDGMWTVRTDSVDTRARTEWQDSTGESNSENLDSLWAEGTRTYGQPATGTACTDTDSDGLPDAYESANSVSTTALDPDYVANGLPAILWYASGRDTAGVLIGCNGTCSAEAGEGGISATFGAVDRYVYIVPTTTMYGIDFPVFDPFSEFRFGVWNPAGDSVLVVSCTAQGTPADSATVHARLTAWARPTLSTAVAVRDHTPFAGMGC